MADPNETTSSVMQAGFTTTSTPAVIIVTITSSQQNTGATTPSPVVVTEFSTYQYTPSATQAPVSTARTSAVPSAGALTSSSKAHKGGLGTGGTIAIAVAVPIAVISLLAILAAVCWRRRKRNREGLAQRKEEQDQYAYHPNETTAVGATASAMSQGAYRGWQPTNVTRNPSSLGNSGFQAGRGGALATGPIIPGASLQARRASSSGFLETPTIPAFGLSDDLDSVVTSSPGVSRYEPIISPGNGSPPLNAMNTDSPASDYSIENHSEQPPYPITSPGIRSSGMASFMPTLQPGYERQPRYTNGNARGDF